MRNMENLIPVITPTKVEKTGKSPVQKDAGKTDSSDNLDFNNSLNKAKDKIEQQSDSNSNGPQTKTNDKDTTSENQQPSSNNQNTVVNNQQLINNKSNISNIISSEAKNVTSQSLENSELGSQTAVQDKNAKLLAIPTQQGNSKGVHNLQKQETTVTQLQTIIENGDVAPDKVSIKASQQIVTSTNPGAINPKNETFTAQQNATSRKTEVTSQRMEAGESILSGKLSQKGVTNISNNKSEQQFLGFENSQQQTPKQNFGTPLSSSPDPLSPLTQTLFATGESQATPVIATNSTSVVMPNSGLVYDDKVLQQIQQQFRTQNHKVQQKIKMQLHPAELGELKIDLTVKEGAIRVNVVAQTRQAQEVLERNIPKLKNILEEQGLTIDEVTIAQAADSSKDFNLFNGQFNGNKNFAQPDNNNKQTDLHSFNEKLIELEGEQEDYTQSINVSSHSGISITI